MRIEYDKLIDRYFLRQPDGRSIYRTWGSLGRSYWVDTAEREQLIRDANRLRLKASRILLPLLIAPAFLMGHLSSSSLYLGWVMLLCTWGAFFLWWEWRNKKLTKGLERAPRLRGHASRERRPSWLDTMAAGQSFTAFLVQLVVLGHSPLMRRKTSHARGRQPCRASWGLLFFGRLS
jgi:hypothetical protein